MKATCLGLLAVLVCTLAGCPAKEESVGPGGASLEPAVGGSTQFAGDELVVSIAANAADEQAEPRITGTEFVIDNLPGTLTAKVERWHGAAGYGQRVKFTAPLGVNSIKAILYVEHLGRIFKVTVPFKHEPRNVQGVKWVRQSEDIAMVGTVGAKGK